MMVKLLFPKSDSAVCLCISLMPDPWGTSNKGMVTEKVCIYSCPYMPPSQTSLHKFFPHFSPCQFYFATNPTICLWCGYCIILQHGTIFRFSWRWCVASMNLLLREEGYNFCSPSIHLVIFLLFLFWWLFFLSQKGLYSCLEAKNVFASEISRFAGRADSNIQTLVWASFLYHCTLKSWVWST